MSDCSRAGSLNRPEQEPDRQMDPLEPVGREAYPYLQSITTRWSDNDVYGHVNNVVYFSYFDTVVNQYLIEQGVLDIHQGGGHRPRGGEHLPLLPVAAVPRPCLRRRSGATPWQQLGGLPDRFRNDQVAPAAQGRFVHVYVDRYSRKPMPLPQSLRAALTPLVRE